MQFCKVTLIAKDNYGQETTSSFYVYVDFYEPEDDDDNGIAT